ncbi:MAG: hypothetical protein MJZ34_02600 [Paludibacteraceae bacterium]|nr:hypothetical protein [Paludibacteraceae bacterium]
MTQTYTRYVVQRNDGFFWMGGRNNFFIPDMIGAKIYTTRDSAEKQLNNTWWWTDEWHKENYVIKEVTINYEVNT